MSNLIKQINNLRPNLGINLLKLGGLGVAIEGVFIQDQDIITQGLFMIGYGGSIKWIETKKPCEKVIKGICKDYHERKYNKK